MPDQLIELNSLEKNSAQVWVNPSLNEEFGYSDGTDEQQYLVNVLQSATDLSINSAELAAAIHDWASEYHLSSSRSNLLRSIKFKENSKILELGCGCGAISRYLGEEGHQVTAVEGSLKRAEIAHLRNRDLTNVEIITHNFNSLELPEHHYDAVLFIGALEYAKRFSDQQDITAEQAVINLLNKAADALINDGLIVIAIENRTGLKYEHGGLEDHLAIPNVGLDDYIGYEFTGIKTYDYSQWQQLFAQCHLTNRFYFPFPDYKLPSMLINDDVDQQTSHYLSTQIHSYDPISDWTMPQPENKKWNEVFTRSTLKTKANSFGIIACKAEKVLADVFKNTWCLNDSSEIKEDYKIVLTNTNQEISNNNNDIKRLFNVLNDINGSLKNIWMEKFSDSPSLATLENLARQLYQTIQNDYPANSLVEIDQMMVCGQDSILQFSKYWHLESRVTAEQELFHALLDFCIKSKKILSKAHDLNFLSLNKIISKCFIAAGINYSDYEAELIGFEQNFRNKTLTNPTFIDQELTERISNLNQFKFDYINVQLFFATQNQPFSPDNLITQRLKQTGKVTTLYFSPLNPENILFRFDPCDHEHGINHFFSINNIEFQHHQSGEFYQLQLNNDLETHDLEIIGADKLIYKVIGIDPQIVFSLPADLKKTSASYNLLLQLQWLGL